MQETIQEKLLLYFKSTTGEMLANDANLFDAGALDSFGVVEFLSFLEKEFGVEIQIEDITMDNFSTVERIAVLVAESGGHA